MCYFFKKSRHPLSNVGKIVHLVLRNGVGRGKGDKRQPQNGWVGEMYIFGR